MRLIDADELIGEVEKIPLRITENLKPLAVLRECKKLIIMMISEQLTVGEWIPVQDASPEDGQLVLVTTNGGVYLVEFDDDLDAPYGDMDDVTAWMPIPEPYKGD